MNMQDLIAATAREQGLSKAKTKRVLNSLINTINDSIVAGQDFRVSGIGTFKAVQRDERTCRNPTNGEPVVVPARWAPKISFAKNLKRNVASRPLP